MLKGYFPAQWKVAQIILILKSGKPPDEITSYRPISLLPIISKVFEKLLLKRLLPMVENSRLIPNHQFGIRHRHSTIEQTHRIAQRIDEAIETNQYSSAAFLDIPQAFDKIWHTGLLYKLRQSLPLNYYLILKPDLHLPINTPAEDIAEGLVDLGLDVISVKQMSTDRRSPEGTPIILPLFLVTLPRTIKS
jgi:hypothetical protein